MLDWSQRETEVKFSDLEWMFLDVSLKDCSQKETEAKLCVVPTVVWKKCWLFWWFVKNVLWVMLMVVWKMCVVRWPLLKRHGVCFAVKCWNICCAVLTGFGKCFVNRCWKVCCVLCWQVLKKAFCVLCWQVLKHVLCCSDRCWKVCCVSRCWKVCCVSRCWKVLCLVMTSVETYAALFWQALKSVCCSDRCWKVCVVPTGVEKCVACCANRCGFSRQLCEEALQVCDEDVGAALEYMLTELRSLDLPLDSSSTEGDLPQEIIEQREEEKLALKSIYEHRFEERIANRVWLLHLDLPELKEMLHFQKGFESKKEKREVCRFYRKGHCRFGDKCHQLHVSADVDMKKQADKLQGPLADNLFTLEIRFPEGNRYPMEVPLIAFSSLIDRLPPHTRVNISRFLMQSAQQWAEMQSPAIFSLVALLEDRDQLEMLLEMPPPPIPGSDLSVGSSQPKHEPSRQKNSSHSESDRKDCGQSDDRSHPVKEVTDRPPDRGKHSVPDQTLAKRFHPKDSRDTHSDKSANVLKQNKKLKDEFRKKAVSWTDLMSVSFLKNSSLSLWVLHSEMPWVMQYDFLGVSCWLRIWLFCRVLCCFAFMFITVNFVITLRANLTLTLTVFWVGHVVVIIFLGWSCCGHHLCFQRVKTQQSRK